MALSLKNLYYRPKLFDDSMHEESSSVGDGGTVRVSVGVAHPFGMLPENFFDWPEAKIVANYWTKECTAAVEKLMDEKEGDATWQSFKIKDVLGKEEYAELLALLKESKPQYEQRGLWTHGYSTPPVYFAEALIPALKEKKELVYEDKKPVDQLGLPGASEIPASRPNPAKIINQPLAEGQDLSSIKKCILCGSDQISAFEKKGFLGINKYKVVTCGNCGATFQRKLKEGEADGSWHLKETKDEASKVWGEYKFEKLSSREWVNIGNGGMSDAKQRVADIEDWLERVSAGTININFKGVESPVILRPGEELLFTLPNVTLKEPRAVRKSSGGYAGPSFRIAKGVYFRMGRFGSTSTSSQEIKDLDRGVLTITNQRFMFSGNMKTVNLDIRKIMQIDPFRDGIGLHKDGRERTQYFVWNENMGRMQLSVGDRSYAETINGMIVKCLIEGAVRNYIRRK